MTVLLPSSRVSTKSLKLDILSHLPVAHVVRLADAHRPPRVEQRPHGVVVPSRHDELLVYGRRARLFARDEARADPDARRAVGERGREASAVGDAACCDHRDGLSGERAGGAFAEVDDGGDEDRERRVARVASAFAALGADDVNTCGL